MGLFLNILKNIGVFVAKSLEMGTYFQKNYPCIWVWVLSLAWHTTEQTKSEYPSPGLHQWSSSYETGSERFPFFFFLQITKHTQIKIMAHLYWGWEWVFKTQNIYKEIS